MIHINFLTCQIIDWPTPFFFVPFNRDWSSPFFFVLSPQTNHIYFTVTQSKAQTDTEHWTLNTTLILKLLNCTLSNFRCLCNFFWSLLFLGCNLPGQALSSLYLSYLSLTVYNFMFLHESSPMTYFTLVLSQSPSHYFGSVCLLSSQMHLSAYTFTDTFSTLIVPLHSLHFHICLGSGRKLALIKMYPRLLSHSKHVSPSHDASEHAYHTYIWSVIGFNYFFSNWCTCYEPMMAFLIGWWGHILHSSFSTRISICAVNGLFLETCTH